MPFVITEDCEISVLTEAGPALPLAATLLYSTDDPFAVSVLLRAGEMGDITWRFARDLLSQGVRYPAGDGDVHVWATGRGHHQQLRIRIRGAVDFSHDVEATLVFRSADVNQFLSRTYRLVTRGQEAIDFDRELSMLLAEG
ncbi:SsgA family sporulation/cell division regulator [Streptomyces sp. TRM66268-LWL]|uniref:SsgA family sporulation/cell division regulator n=1 Tax=Streptomyces polyasparticus TaxID=2767826 RepID=A0ABR7SY38_9ACTN|nr:SsgA family sporulation/cell division regulator [Streptomyces polyasparticus]MBC9719590.1 SsgA family sporulation/cell division regulator [Streptomyces polyasparticus]